MVFLKFQAVRADGVLEGVALPHQVTQIHMELGFLAGAVEVVEYPEPLHRVQLLAVGVQMAQPGGDVRRYPVKKVRASSMLLRWTDRVTYRSWTTLLEVSVTLSISMALYSAR